MHVPSPHAATHRYHLFLLLSAILDNEYLAKHCYFKGGTAATMLGLLDRFSVDLDFDIAEESNQSKIHTELESIFKKLHYPVKDQSQRAVQYLVGYEASGTLRSTVKIEMIGHTYHHGEYEIKYLPDIDRYATVQTVSTLVANKLTTPLDRWSRHHTIAGRDLYDIHHFLTHGLPYNAELITERSGLLLGDFFSTLITFIEDNVTQTAIDQDLNTLLDPPTFKKLRLHLKNDTLLALRAQLSNV